jgi:hypothetical protein
MKIFDKILFSHENYLNLWATGKKKQNVQKRKKKNFYLYFFLENEIEIFLDFYCFERHLSFLIER